MKPLPSAPHDGDEVGPLKDVEMLRRRLARHLEALTKLSQRLAVVLPQTIEQKPPGGVGQCLEDRVHPARLNAHPTIMQVFTCISQPLPRSVHPSVGGTGDERCPYQTNGAGSSNTSWSPRNAARAA